MSDVPAPTTPQSDADRIRLKRLAKLAGTSNSGASSAAPGSPDPSVPADASGTSNNTSLGESSSAKTSTSPRTGITVKPNPSAKPATPQSQVHSNKSFSAPSSHFSTPNKFLGRTAQHSQSAAPTPRHKPSPQPFVFSKWEEDTVETVFGVALNNDIAKRRNLVWLKDVEKERIDDFPETPQPVRAKAEFADRLLIERLGMDPQAMTDDTGKISVLASLPTSQTSLEYLVGCWRRINTQRSLLIKRGVAQNDLQQATGVLDNLKELVISYAGLTMQDPSMFPQPEGKTVGPDELLPSLHALASNTSVFASTSETQTLLNPSTELELFLTDLGKRFENEGLEDILGNLVKKLTFSPALAVGMVHTTSTLAMLPGALGLSPNSWQTTLTALACLFSIKPIAAMITRLPEWNPEVWSEETDTGVKNGNEHERASILGMIMRLGIFGRDWPAVLSGYYKDFDTMTARDREGSDMTLKSSLTNLTTSIFSIVNSVVRAGPEPREAFLAFVGRVVSLNQKRAAMRFKYETKASDSFMHNLHYTLLRLAEPFMDSQYKGIDKIDLRYYERSDRIDLTDLTRISATPPEIEEWESADDAKGPPPNFVSDVFYLLAAVNHLATPPIDNYLSAMHRHVKDIQKQLDMMERDESWRGGPQQPQVEAALQRGKAEVSKLHASMETMYVALLRDEFAGRSVGYASFASVWLLRLVDPKKEFPRSALNLPLPQEVPLVFKVQPEYMFEDIVDFWDMMMKWKPTLFDPVGQKEIVEFSITFLSSTWYITNPYLKSKIVTVLAIGVRPFRRFTVGMLGDILCKHPLSLKHLMMCMMSFYVECEKTGTHTQFYDKFQIRRDIAEVMQSVWRDPTHRAVMENFTSNADEFIKFANRLMNDVTFMLDELLTKLAEIKRLQMEMSRKDEWDALTQEEREDKTSKLRAAEGLVESWTIYSREFLSLLIEFTGSSKAPFVSGEIVGRLAAMLDYVLVQLAGPRCSDLKSKDMDKYGFDPKELLSKVLQIYINLSTESAFIHAIATEGRSYSKEVFDRAFAIAKDKFLKSQEELETFASLAEKVEQVRVAMDEEEIDEFPEEFEDPLMATLMRNPVILPSSKTVIDLSTIRAHLLSDPTDPFNRVPLKIEDVVPNVELKQRIDDWLAEKRAKAAAARLATMSETAADDTRMETDEADA